MGCVLFLEKLFSVGMSAEAALVINPGIRLRLNHCHGNSVRIYPCRLHVWFCSRSESLKRLSGVNLNCVLLSDEHSAVPGSHLPAHTSSS